MRFQRSFLRHLLALGIVTGITSFSTAAFAAKQVVLKYRIFRESVSVSELTTFAETGQTSSNLQTYLRMSGQKPEAVRQSLTRQVRINPILLDRVLNSPIGNTLLDPLAQAIQTPANVENRKALRAALVLSASGDGKFSLLEVVQNYPTQEVLLDGDRIEDAYRRLSELADRLQTPLGNILFKK
jgi:Alpha/beta hydrolase of unknown function (DUF1400)